eukprot:TRINITY_DN3956_c0_g1_i1.p1 TRINITY_DN3956_c0_g1~~TRINITY_DN3956_c0_g1_i1.p1  ORF type:complete len:705 (+),score=180.07 TRINITY_DN3956_c0_g1_i1:90-2204(+)
MTAADLRMSGISLNSKSELPEAPGIPEAAPPMLDMDVPILPQAMGAAYIEDSRAYRTLQQAGLLVHKYRKPCFEAVFGTLDLKANTSKEKNCRAKCKYGVYWCPVLGCVAYGATHLELFVPAGHIGLLMDSEQHYLFAQPGMHNISMGTCVPVLLQHVDTQPLPVNKDLRHGDRTIAVVEQGYVGVANDNGEPVLLPPGIHMWTSDSLKFQESVPLDQDIVKLGPYTLLTVDEGYAAITQNNGKQEIVMGGQTYLLNHKNWTFAKYLTLKIQTESLKTESGGQIVATSADNINLNITATITWKIVDPIVAASQGADTMSTKNKSGAASQDIPKLRKDVNQQGIASLTSFVGSVNFSDTQHVSSKMHEKGDKHAGGSSPSGSSTRQQKNNPIFNTEKMTESVRLANVKTAAYGVQILSINILSAVPSDGGLAKALTMGAVESAKALMSETAARGNAKAMRIQAEAQKDCERLEAEGKANAEVIIAEAAAQAERLVADGEKQAAELLQTSRLAVELQMIERSAELTNNGDVLIFAQDKAYMSRVMANQLALGDDDSSSSDDEDEEEAPAQQPASKKGPAAKQAPAVIPPPPAPPTRYSLQVKEREVARDAAIEEDDLLLLSTDFEDFAFAEEEEVLPSEDEDSGLSSGDEMRELLLESSSPAKAPPLPQRPPARAPATGQGQAKARAPATGQSKAKAKGKPKARAS